MLQNNQADKVFAHPAGPNPKTILSRRIGLMADHQVIINSRIYKLVPLRFCKCGCGKPTKIATSTGSGHIKGEPKDFINGHNGRGINSARWKGGKYTRKDGYVFLTMPSHPKAGLNGQVLEHVVIVETVLGKPMPEKAVIHHIDGKPYNNGKTNFVVCEDNNYHKLIHQRTRAYKACGHANWRKCRKCLQYSDPGTMYKERTSYRHHNCHWVKS